MSTDDWLTWRVGRELYASALAEVAEIRPFEPPAPLPVPRPHIVGTLRWQGRHVPVIDLRTRMGASPRCTPATALLVLAWPQRTVAVVVDAVLEAVSLAARDIIAPPAINRRGDGACIVGIAATGPAAGVQTLILLDLERLLGGEAAPVQNTCSGARNS